MLTSIIIVNFNTLDNLKNCVKSIRKHTTDYELIIVDNGSKEEGTEDFIRKNSDEYILNPGNFGFAIGSNEGERISKGELICFLNSDTIVEKDWLKLMKKTLNTNPKCVAVGPLGNPRYKQVKEVCYQYQQYVGQYSVDTRVFFLSGYCLLVYREEFEKYYFDEEFNLGLYEDNLLCEQIKFAGGELWVSSNAIVTHLGSETFRKNNINYEDLEKVNQIIFRRKMEELHG